MEAIKLSDFFQELQIETNVNAIFNSLVMEVVFVDNATLERIKNYDIEDSKKKILLECGIYTSQKRDNLAFNSLTNEVLNLTKKISIMYLSLSTACNLNCNYCYVNKNPLNTKKCDNMSVTVAERAVDLFFESVSKHSLDNYAQITFYGGEPLINKEVLMHIVPYIRHFSKNVDLAIVTNGTLIDKSLALFFKKYHIGIGVSLDGPKELNDANRTFVNGNQSVYDSVSKSIEILNETNCNYSLSATLTEQVINRGLSVIDDFEKLGVKNVFWNLLHFSQFDANWENHYNKMSSFFLESYDYMQSKALMHINLYDYIKAFTDKNFRYQGCGVIGLNEVAIQPNGDITICPGDQRSTSHVVGNVLSINSYDEIFTQTNKEHWLMSHTISRIECKQCPALFICGGGCPLQAEALFGSRDHIDNASCIFYKNLITWLIKKYYNELTEKEKTV